MYSLDDYDGQILMKKLTKGAFLLPAASDDGAPYVIMKPKMIGKLFRS
jgi:hypothetical protein